MLMKLCEAIRRLRLRAADCRGQNTVEYLLMLTVMVAIVLLVGSFLKNKMPGLMNQIMEKISGVAGGM